MTFVFFWGGARLVYWVEHSPFPPSLSIPAHHSIPTTCNTYGFGDMFTILNHFREYGFTEREQKKLAFSMMASLFRDSKRKSNTKYEAFEVDLKSRVDRMPLSVLSEWYQTALQVELHSEKAGSYRAGSWTFTACLIQRAHPPNYFHYAKKTSRRICKKQIAKRYGQRLFSASEGSTSYLRLTVFSILCLVKSKKKIHPLARALSPSLPSFFLKKNNHTQTKALKIYRYIISKDKTCPPALFVKK